MFDKAHFPMVQLVDATFLSSGEMESARLTGLGRLLALDMENDIEMGHTLAEEASEHGLNVSQVRFILALWIREQHYPDQRFF